MMMGSSSTISTSLGRADIVRVPAISDDRDCPLPMPTSTPAGSRNQRTTSPFNCLCTCEHRFHVRTGYGHRPDKGRNMGRINTLNIERPHNNLLRRLNAADYG